MRQKFAFLDEGTELEEVAAELLGQKIYNGKTPIYIRTGREISGLDYVHVISNMPITAKQMKEYLKEKDCCEGCGLLPKFCTC